MTAYNNRNNGRQIPVTLDPLLAPRQFVLVQAPSPIEAQRLQFELLQQGLLSGVFTANEVRAQMGLEMPDANVPAFIDTTIEAIRSAEEIQARYGPGANEVAVMRPEPRVIHHCGFCGKESREGDSWCCQRRREAHEMPAPPIPTDWMFTAEAARAIQPALPPAPTKTRRGYRFEDFPEEG